MKRFVISAAFTSLLAFGWIFGPDSATRASTKTSGQGKMTFQVLYTSSHLPAEAQVPEVLTAAHGGFAVDRRPGKGETYFALPGAGIIQISADMKSTRMITTPPPLKDTNLHNTTIWYADGNAFLTFPANKAEAVFTTTPDGTLVNTLTTPAPGVDLGQPIPNEYFAGAGNFIPTDTDYLDGTLYVATGYSLLDFVLTAKIASTKPFKAEWQDLSFGGRGVGLGQFQKGHGITIPPGTKIIEVADRLNSEFDRFTRHGQLLSTRKMPLGSLPCDIDYLDDYALVPSLSGPNATKGAPIYIFQDDKLISTIMIKEDLGLAKFDHIHNAVLHKYNGKYYVIAQAWNPGDFAILEQVVN